MKDQNEESRIDPWIKIMQFGRFMGCHQRADRSFFIKKKQFPVCARCTGVLIGQFLAIILFLLNVRLNVFIAIGFCGIMFLDWFIQKINVLQSNNIRRVITGLLGGYGYITVVCHVIVFAINLIIKQI